MADRKRKRKSSASRATPSRNGASAPAGATSPKPKQSGAEMMKRGYARAEEKNQATREALEPLQPGERPGILVAAVAWIVVIAVVMTYNAIASNGLSNGSRVGNGVMVVLIAVAAFGTWRLEYWAILGTQTLLALTLVSLVLAAMVVANLWLVLLAVVGALVSGYLFYKMVKVMARVQKTAMLKREAEEGR